MDEERAKLIREIEEMRKNIALEPYPRGYLEALETGELKNIHISYKELQPYYHQQDYKKNRFALNVKKEIGILCAVVLFTPKSILSWGR